MQQKGKLWFSKRVNNDYLKGSFLAFLVLSATVGLVYLSQNFSETKSFSKVNTNSERKLQIGYTTITVETADSPVEQAKGLSGRESLGENRGMYFVLEKRGLISFWMKEMKFSIDIIWVDRDTIIGFVENAPLPSEEGIPTFKSPSPVTHVLEVNAGFVQQHDLEVGQEIVELK